MSENLFMRFVIKLVEGKLKLVEDKRAFAFSKFKLVEDKRAFAFSKFKLVEDKRANARLSKL